MRLFVRARPRGFTLLELIVALGLFMMLVAAVYSSWMLIMRGAEVGLKAAAEAQRSRMAIHTIEESLASVRSFAANIQHYSFIAENGSDATLSFVSQLPESFPRSGRFDSDVRRVTFAVEPGGDGSRRLVLRQNVPLRELMEDEKEYPVVLARNVREFKMEFWDPRTTDWLEEWAQTNQLPKMVRVTLQLGENNYNTRLKKETVRIIALPSVTVQPVWQSATRSAPPARPGAPGVPGAPVAPGAPGEPRGPTP